MRRFRGLIGLATIAAAAGVATLAIDPGYILEQQAPRPSCQVRRRHGAGFINADRKYRSRWKPDKPKRRRNRLTLSRRVRRRHRRARRK